MAAAMSALSWLCTYGAILDKRNKTIRGGEGPGKFKPNILQQRIDEALLWMRKNKIPARIIVLKPRQVGCSTYVVSDLYHQLSGSSKRAIIAGAVKWQSDNLFEKLKVFSATDLYPWEKKGCNVASEKARWANGSNLEKLTAGGASPGRSGTFQYVVATEYAYWEHEGPSKDETILTGILNGVADEPETTVIIESTANGEEGGFYEKWRDALDFEEYKARHERGEIVFDRFVRVFAAWFEFEEHSIPLSIVQNYEVQSSLTPKEQELVAAHGLTMEQVAWRRMKIRKDCGGSEDQFDQDFPDRPSSAFIHSGSCRFNKAALAELEREVKEPTYCFLHAVEGDFENIATREADRRDAHFLIWEKPVVGYRYILSADTSKGEDMTTGKDTDFHVAMVIRDGFSDENGRWHPPKLVARTTPEFRGMIVPEFSDMIRKLTGFYGNCTVAHEENNTGLVLTFEFKRHQNMRLYNRLEGSGKFGGWITDPKTRDSIIALLTRRVNLYNEENMGIEIPDANTVKNLGQFVRKKNGKYAGVNHDDETMTIAIGVHLLPEATAYKKPKPSLRGSYASVEEEEAAIRRMLGIGDAIQTNQNKAYC